MRDFSFFFVGALMIEFWPLLDKIVEIALTALEYVKGILTIKITKLNTELEKISNDSTEEPVPHVIGFAIPDDEDTEQEE